MKTDPVSGKTFNLDESYRYIKQAVMAADIDCIRADEIQRPGIIDSDMYNFLMSADLVVADLTAQNPNAFFELGVRYALKPWSTIVVAEKGFVSPFNVGHIRIFPYKHGGEIIDRSDAHDFVNTLTESCKKALELEQTDSPVFTFIPGLQAAQTIASDGVTQPQPKQSVAAQNSVASLVARAMQRKEQENFTAMRDLLEVASALMGEAHEPFIVQQHALATYKSKDPNPKSALMAAKDILISLNPDDSTDPETLGLWAAVHKQLNEITDRGDSDRQNDLDVAIQALHKGFTLKHDYYNGINYAYLLNVRASGTTGDEAVADRVIAQRVRRDVIEICQDLIANPVVGQNEHKNRENEYWVRATLKEAYFGIGNQTLASEILNEEVLNKIEPADWMIKSTNDQINKLERLLR